MIVQQIDLYWSTDHYFTDKETSGTDVKKQQKQVNREVIATTSDPWVLIVAIYSLLGVK